MESSSPEPTHVKPFEQRVRHYQDLAERMLSRYGRDFTHFTQGYEQLVSTGDERLRSIETTGYNILQRASDMPLASKKPLIFYGNYIGRARHFGLLLAEMERDGVITPAPNQLRFGTRATKVLYDPEWEEIPPELAQAGIIQRIDQQGEVADHPTIQSVETVITFSPNNNVQAVAIADFLRERATLGISGAIVDSNLDPDIRATAVLRDVLPESKFPNAVANIRSIGQAQVVVLRQETGFPEPWRTTPIEANKELVAYIVGEGVLP